MNFSSEDRKEWENSMKKSLNKVFNNTNNIINKFIIYK